MNEEKTFNSSTWRFEENPEIENRAFVKWLGLKFLLLLLWTIAVGWTIYLAIPRYSMFSEAISVFGMAAGTLVLLIAGGSALVGLVYVASNFFEWLDRNFTGWYLQYELDLDDKVIRRFLRWGKDIHKIVANEARTSESPFYLLVPLGGWLTKPGIYWNEKFRNRTLSLRVEPEERFGTNYFWVFDQGGRMLLSIKQLYSFALTFVQYKFFDFGFSVVEHSEARDRLNAESIAREVKFSTESLERAVHAEGELTRERQSHEKREREYRGLRELFMNVATMIEQSSPSGNAKRTLAAMEGQLRDVLTPDDLVLAHVSRCKKDAIREAERHEPGP